MKISGALCKLQQTERCVLNYDSRVCAYICTMQMSKSRGNVVDPFDQISQFGLDPMRYFLLKEGSLHHDGGMGNLSSR